MEQQKYLHNSQAFPELMTCIKPPIRKLRKQIPSRILENLQSKPYHTQTAEKQRENLIRRRNKSLTCKMRIVVY